MSEDSLFDADAIDRLLRELAAELDHRGVRGRMFVVRACEVITES